MSIFTNPASRSLEEANAYTTAVLDLVGTREPLDLLRETAGALRAAISGLSESQARRPETVGKWSAVQMLQHMADSELVWGYRLRMVLAHDRPPLTGYDQDLWAERLHYADCDPLHALEVFTVLRGANLRLLERASLADRRRAGVHAERGEETVEHMMRLYAGHDVLHLRQLERIRSAVGADP